MQINAKQGFMVSVRDRLQSNSILFGQRLVLLSPLIAKCRLTRGLPVKKQNGFPDQNDKSHEHPRHYLCFYPLTEATFRPWLPHLSPESLAVVERL
jgi:hypothetical protein